MDQPRLSRDLFQTVGLAAIFTTIWFLVPLYLWLLSGEIVPMWVIGQVFWSYLALAVVAAALWARWRHVLIAAVVVAFASGALFAPFLLVLGHAASN